MTFYFTFISFLTFLYPQDQSTTITSNGNSRESAKQSALNKAIAEIKGVYVKTEFESSVTSDGDEVEKSASKSLNMMSLAYSVKIGDEKIDSLDGEFTYTATFSFEDPAVFKNKQIQQFTSYVTTASKDKDVFDKMENLYKAALIAQDMYYPIRVGGQEIASPMDHVLGMMDKIKQDLTIVAKKFSTTEDNTVLYAQLTMYHQQEEISNSKKMLDMGNKRNYRLNDFSVYVDSVKHFDTNKLKKFKLRAGIERVIKKSKNEQLIFMNRFLSKDIKKRFEPIIDAKLTLNIREFIANPDYFDQKNNEAEEKIEKKTYDPRFVTSGVWDLTGIIGKKKAAISNELKKLNRRGLLRTKRKPFKMKKGRVNILFCFDTNEELRNVVVKLDFDNYADYYTGKYIYFNVEKYASIIYTQADQ